jgi:hypothetical protein
MIIRTFWEYSIETETLRILHTAHQIAVGFYRVNNFQVIKPTRNIKPNSQAVLFPDLNYIIIPRFWEKVKRINVKTTPMKVNPKLFENTMQFLSDKSLIEPNFLKAKDLWEKHSAEILNDIFVIIPDKKHVIKSIKIFPTSYGTTSSFSFTPTGKGEMFIYLRQDQGIYAITEAILTCLTKKDVYEELSGEWSESELLVDWLLLKSPISKVLERYEPETNFVSTLRAIRAKQNARLIKESDDFYNKLGLHINKSFFNIKGKSPIINQRAAENLTQAESLILKLLIEKANSVVKTDDIANLMFKAEDDFSLYAISKQIERLRNKLEANGVSGSYIQTLRGQGYLLKN